TISCTQRAQRFADSCRMMREVVDDEHALFLATHLRTSFHVLKTRQRALNLVFADSPRISRNDHSETVQQIKLADERRLKLAPRLVLAKHFEPRESFAKLSITNLPLRARVRAESLKTREKPFAERLDYRTYMGTVPTSDQPAILRHEIHETSKR